MCKPSKLSLKLVWNEAVSLNFEEVIAKKDQMSMFSQILNNFRNNQHFKGIRYKIHDYMFYTPYKNVYLRKSNIGIFQTFLFEL